MWPSPFFWAFSSYFLSYLLPASLQTTGLKTLFPIPIPMSLKRCTFVWGCRGNGLIFHGTLYLMAVNSLNGAYQHNQINYLPRHWQYYHLREKYSKWWNRNYLFFCKLVQPLPEMWNSISTSKKERLTFSSWVVPLLRRWWRRGGCRRWLRRSSPCGPFVSPAPQRQVCVWLLLKNITMHIDQTEKVQLIGQTMKQIQWLFDFVYTNQTGECISILSAFPLDSTVCRSEVD